MRNLLQSLADWLWPVHPRAHPPGVDPHVYLRPLIVLFIVLLCGPEVFAAADLVAMLDLLGAVLFLTAFGAGARALGLAALARMKSILVPTEWGVLLKARTRPSIVAHGLLLIGVNALIFSVNCLVATVCVFEVVKEVV
jgi:hypothetical protein